MTTEATNTTASSEGTHVAKGNSAISFSEMEQIENAEAKAKREKASQAKREAKTKAPDDQKESKKEPIAPIDTGAGGNRNNQPKKESAPKEKKDPKDQQGDGEADAGGDLDSEEGGLKRKAAKVHKFRVGDDEHELSGDAVVTHMVNGKPEEIPLQELLNNYSGKVDYSRKYGEFGKEKDKFTREKAELDGFVGEFFRRSQEDPDTAWDLLATAANKDPIEFKEAMARAQYAQMEPLFVMTPDEREQWFHEQKIGWREKNVQSAEKAQKDAVAKQRSTQEISALRDKYDLDEDSWNKNYLQAKKIVGDKEPSPNQVVAASRYMMVFDSIKSSAPHLEQHPKYDTLVHSYVEDLMKNPAIGKAQFEHLLREVWSKDDDTNLKKVSKKAIERAEADGTDLRNKSKPKGKDDLWSFEQL